MIILYTFLIFIIIILSIGIYIRTKSPFWSIQPVFHIYNLLYWIKPCGVISYDLPCVNKYVNYIDIKTECITKLNKTEKQYVINFLNNYYLKTNNVKYVPTYNHIFNYFKSNTHPAFITIYKKPKVLTYNDKFIQHEEYLGLLTAKVLYIKINTIKNKKIDFPIYYVDNLCVNKNHRKKGIAPQLIQTHYYDIRRKNKDIITCLFKREGELTAIVPLTTYSTNGYNILHIINYYPKLNPQFKHIKITKQTFYLLTHFLNLNYNKFSCVIMPDLSNLLYLINNNNISIYSIMVNNTIYAIYIFREPCLKYNFKDTEERVVELIASINLNLHINVFILGFIYSLHSIFKTSNYKYLLIENISNNNILIDYLKTKNIQEFVKSPTGFFLYNYAIYSFEASKCLFIY